MLLGIADIVSAPITNRSRIRRWLGQKTLAMAIHYSETAATSRQMRSELKKFDPLGRKTRTKLPST